MQRHRGREMALHACKRHFLRGTSFSGHAYDQYSEQACSYSTAVSEPDAIMIGGKTADSGNACMEQLNAFMTLSEFCAEQMFRVLSCVLIQHSCFWARCNHDRWQDP
jgi:hypothetical protein